MKRDSGGNLTAIFERLNRDYEDKFAQLGAGFDAWASDIDIGVNVEFEGPKGPRWTQSVRYAKDNNRMLPPFERLMPVQEAERLLRERIDELMDHLWVVFRDAPWDHQPPQPEFKRRRSR
jgi:hypothetical protein